MSVYKNITDGNLYGLYWQIYSAQARPELIAVSKSSEYKTIRNANRMDFVTLSNEARVAAASATRNDP